MEIAREKDANQTVMSADFDKKRTYFDSGATLTFAYRKSMLRALKAGIRKFEQEIIRALHADLKKSETEAFMTELTVVYDEISHTLSHLREWMAPKTRSTPLALQPSSSKTHYGPKGVVLIISPWNYPFMLSISPLVSAIAAGNCAVIKPSEDAPHVATIIDAMIRDTFGNHYISAVTGEGRTVVTALLSDHVFNHIFFTGSTAVGSIIAVQAARTLTSTTLELGGKSPAIVDDSANLRVAARRLVWGKFTNAGQTCVAPDYLLVHTSVKEALLKEVKSAIVEFYGAEPKASPDFGRMVNEKRFDAVSALLKDGNILHGGDSDRKALYIAPTILEPASMESAVMQEEIFGPVWPWLTWENKEELLEIIRRNRYPLACYYFGSNGETERFVLSRIEFGGGCVNNAVVHLGNPDLPFGGVQGSGSGHYHGWFGFECFSNTKSIIKTSTWVDPSIKYPPYGPAKLKWLKRILG